MSEDKLNQKEVRAGALQSSLSILLHTHYAIRLWEGRLPGRESANVPRISHLMIQMTAGYNTSKL